MVNSSENNSAPVVAATVLALAFAVVAVILRYIARRYQRMSTYAEDWFIYLALACKVGIDIGGVVLLQHGLGRHITTLTPGQLVVFAKTQYSGSFLYPLCITFVKLSILFQYRRLFSVHSKTFRWQIDILIGLVTAWGIAIIFTAFFLCVPMSKLWDLDPTAPGTCIDIVKFYYGLQIPNILTDLLIIVVPIREVMMLDLTKKLKIGAMAMLSLGIITLIFDIVRLVVMLELQSAGPDSTYNLVDAAVWTTVEPSVAIVTVCIPSVRSLKRARMQSRAFSAQWGSDASTIVTGSVQECSKPGESQQQDVEIAELKPSESRDGLKDHAAIPGEAPHLQWPRVSLLLESERPFARFEEFDGRQRR